MATEIEHARRLFTVEEYGRMVEAGILHKDDRVELIDGEIIEMAPIGHRHTACVSNVAELLVTTRRLARLAKTGSRTTHRVLKCPGAPGSGVSPPAERSSSGIATRTHPRADLR